MSAHSAVCAGCGHEWEAASEDALVRLLAACRAMDAPAVTDAREFTTKDKWHLFREGRS